MNQKKSLGKFWKHLFLSEDVKGTFDIFAVVGLQSRVGRNKHIILLDYDNYPLKKIKSEIINVRRKIRNLYRPFYIIETSKRKYAVLSFNTVDWRTFKKIIFMCHIDRKHRRVTLRNKQATLRITRKNYQTFSIPRVKSRIGRVYEPTEIENTFLTIAGYEAWHNLI